MTNPRTLALIASALLLAAGCGNDPAAGDDSDTATAGDTFEASDACSTGSGGCACYGNGACNPGLTCVAEVCTSGADTSTSDTATPTDTTTPTDTDAPTDTVATDTGTTDTATPTDTGAPADTAQDDTVTSDTATPEDTGGTCVAGAQGCPCDGGACDSGLVCDASVCRAALTCFDLDCTALHRDCLAASSGADAECTGCRAGYVEDGGVCVSTASGALTCAELSCTAYEDCYEGAGGADAECRQRPCASPTQAYDISVGGCVECNTPANCPGAEGYWGYTIGTDGACLCETVTGTFYDGSGDETEPCDLDGDGWIRSAAKAAIEGADGLVNPVSLDQQAKIAIADNARCTLRTIDRFVLENELGQQMAVFSCESDGLVPAHCTANDPQCARQLAPEDTCGGGVLPLGLYEPEDLDWEYRVAGNTSDFPSLADAGTGRSLVARELNPLTRACVTGNGDHNQNDFADVDDHQRQAVWGGHPELVPFLKMAYFVELYRGWYAPPVTLDGVDGAYVIQERSRCADDFPIAYADGGEYWRGCTRNRDTAYSANPGALTPIGFDFAQWSCDALEGTCEVPIPPVPAETTGTVPEHGLCDVATPFTGDGMWRGMSHHSQFKCVRITTTAADTPQAPNVVAKGDLWCDDPVTCPNTPGLRRYQLNRCRVDCPAGDPGCAADCDPTTGTCGVSSEASPVDIPNPSSPRIVCEPVTDLDEAADVGFVAVRFGFIPELEDASRPTTAERGCIDEWTPYTRDTDDNPSTLDGEEVWRELCPGYAENPSGAAGLSSPLNFGKLACGCNPSYGGVLCDVGCASAPAYREGEACDGCPGPMHGGFGYDGDGGCQVSGYCTTVPGDGLDDPGGRRGAWMCAGPSLVSGPDDAFMTAATGGHTFSLRGALSPAPTFVAPLCQNPLTCNSGFRLSFDR